MAIENERKLILRLDQAAHILQKLSQQQLNYGIKFSNIQQSYLCDHARVRSVISTSSSLLPMGPTHYYFTYKIPTVDDQLVEIETEISKQDHDQLTLVCKGSVSKTRAKFASGDITWDVDFLRDNHHQIIMVMAEAEMPADQTHLPEIHTLLAPYAISWVDKNDRSFDNKNLVNPASARQLLLERFPCSNSPRTLL
jgi:CYTH domain-containing protein